MDENDNGSSDWSLDSLNKSNAKATAISCSNGMSLLSLVKSNMDQKWIHTCGGAAGGLASAIIVCPLDIVKIRLQNQGKVAAGAAPKYRGMLNSLYVIWKEEGITKGWYRGLRATTAAYIVDRSIWFPTYHSMKSVFADTFGVPVTDTVVHLNASVFASVVCLFSTNPLWIVRTRIMTSSANHTRLDANSTSVSHHLTKMLRNEGMSSWFTGIGPSLIGISHVAVQFPLYERLKSALIRKNSNQEPKQLNHLSLLFASSFSKMVASLITYPHEVIRTRMYTEKHQIALLSASETSKDSKPLSIGAKNNHESGSHTQTAKPPKLKYGSMLQATRTIMIEEGWKGFYKGLGTTLLRTVPSTAISLYIYEWIVYHLG